MYKLGLEKTEEPEIKLSTFSWNIKRASWIPLKTKQNKQTNKKPTSPSLTTLNLFTVWITTNCENC